MDAIQQLLSGLQKIPTAIAGGPVDLSNLVLGVLSGKGLSGVAEKPVGGSAWLNEKFGIEGAGPISDAVELLGSSINPASAVKSLAVLVPALVTKKASTALKARQALKKGADPAEVFADTGIYQNPGLQTELMAVISDANSRLKMDMLGREEGLQAIMGGPGMMVFVESGARDNLSDILDHPELFSKIPELKDIKVRPLFGGFEKAAYNPATKTISMGAFTKPEKFQSTLLHETQHAIQDMFDLPAGGSPDMFFQNPKAFNEASSTIRDLRSELSNKILEGSIPKDDASYLQNVMDDWSNTFNIARHKSFQNYYALSGEAEARTVQRMFENPALSKTFPPEVTNQDLSNRGLSMEQLMNPQGLLPQVDNDPVIRALIQQVSESKAVKK